MWLVHYFFIIVMWKLFLTRRSQWLFDVYQAIGLSYELNYAVWWSGMCLFFAAVIYARVAQLDIKRRSVWVVLSVAMLALCIDEIGSLHETIAFEGGWNALIPFVVVFCAAFLWALSVLLKDRHTRIPGVLLIIGVLIFACVAGLEFVEHNIEIGSRLTQYRIVGEEGAELIAMGILITSGLMAYCRLSPDGFSNPSLSNISSVCEIIFKYPHVIFGIFLAQLALTLGFAVPNFSLFPEGNISSLFPILMFMSLGLFCINRSKVESENTCWLILGVVFIFTSMLQIYNFNLFLNQLFGWEIDWLLSPPDSWLITLVPWVVICGYSLKQNCFQPGRYLTHLALMLLVLVLMTPDFKFPYRIDYLYFGYSSFIAYSCYYVMLGILENKKQVMQSA